MTWLIWRQFRTQAIAGYAALAAAAVVLALTGPRLAHLASLHLNVFDQLTSTDRGLFYGGIVVVALAPALMGAFWGAPLVARELESGTYRLAWSQSVTRTRWLAMKLGFIASAAAAAAGLLSWAVTWWSDPIDGAVGNAHGSLPSRLTPVSFAMRGIAPIGYAVFAVALGVTLGIVLRRTLVAMALTLAVFTALQLAVPQWVRPHLLAPVSATVTISEATVDGLFSNGPGTPIQLTVHARHGGDWILRNQTVDAYGRPVALPSWMSDCLPAPPDPGTAPRNAVPTRSTLSACFDRLTVQGYRQRPCSPDSRSGGPAAASGEPTAPQASGPARVRREPVRCKLVLFDHVVPYAGCRCPWCLAGLCLGEPCRAYQLSARPLPSEDPCPAPT
jgi:ABC-2 family transporter protein